MKCFLPLVPGLCNQDTPYPEAYPRVLQKMSLFAHQQTVSSSSTHLFRAGGMIQMHLMGPWGLALVPTFPPTSHCGPRNE